MEQFLIDNNEISHYFFATFTATGMAFMVEAENKTSEAIIAATAIVNRLTFITHDIGSKNISQLRVIDPHNL